MLCYSTLGVWLIVVLLLYLSLAQPVNVTAIETTEQTSVSPHLQLISQDVIHDKVAMAMKKVIRVNPLDLPSLKDATGTSTLDSSVYKIQTLTPYNGQRKYYELQRIKPLPGEVTIDANYSKISRTSSLLPSPVDKTSKGKHQPKGKKLHFLYDQTDLAGNLLSKSMPVHLTPGAYPVYYMIARTNGRFGKYPLKSFSSAQDFRKYLQRNKIENTTNVLPATKNDV